jgi:acyl-CoA thioesterase I
MAQRVLAALAALLLTSCGSPITDLHQRVVFIGDSITARWDLQSFFGTEATNKGIEGQSADQIAARFQNDVINLRPAVVVILAGSNDVRSGTDLTMARDAVVGMVDSAHAVGIRPIVCTIPPMTDHLDGVQLYNQLLTSDPRLEVSCDYHAVLSRPDGTPLPGVLHDGLHPSLSGYLLMAAEIKQVINGP